MISPLSVSSDGVVSSRPREAPGRKSPLCLIMLSQSPSFSSNHGHSFSWGWISSIRRSRRVINRFWCGSEWPSCTVDTCSRGRRSLCSRPRDHTGWRLWICPCPDILNTVSPRLRHHQGLKNKTRGVKAAVLQTTFWHFYFLTWKIFPKFHLAIRQTISWFQVNENVSDFKVMSHE